MGLCSLLPRPLSLQEIQLCDRGSQPAAWPGPGIVTEPVLRTADAPTALSGRRQRQDRTPVFTRLTWATEVLLWVSGRGGQELDLHLCSTDVLTKPRRSFAGCFPRAGGGWPPGRLGTGSSGSSEHEYYRDVEPKLRRPQESNTVGLPLAVPGTSRCAHPARGRKSAVPVTQVSASPRPRTRLSPQAASRQLHCPLPFSPLAAEGGPNLTASSMPLASPGLAESWDPAVTSRLHSHQQPRLPRWLVPLGAVNAQMGSGILFLLKQESHQRPWGRGRRTRSCSRVCAPCRAV